MGGGTTGTAAVGRAQPAAISNRPLAQNSQLREMQVLAITNIGLPRSLFIPAGSDQADFAFECFSDGFDRVSGKWRRSPRIAKYRIGAMFRALFMGARVAKAETRSSSTHHRCVEAVTSLSGYVWKMEEKGGIPELEQTGLPLILTVR
jgi:hypothetical protein